jgi:hypothetical protein
MKFVIGDQAVPGRDWASASKRRRNSQKNRMGETNINPKRTTNAQRWRHFRQNRDDVRSCHECMSAAGEGGPVSQPEDPVWEV